MGKTKTQRETRDFSMTLVIKTHQNNNNKKYINFFGEGPRPINDIPIAATKKVISGNSMSPLIRGH
jgi:hypothetical protein